MEAGNKGKRPVKPGREVFFLGGWGNFLEVGMGVHQGLLLLFVKCFLNGFQMCLFECVGYGCSFNCMQKNGGVFAILCFSCSFLNCVSCGVHASSLFVS